MSANAVMTTSAASTAAAPGAAAAADPARAREVGDEAGEGAREGVGDGGVVAVAIAAGDTEAVPPPPTWPAPLCEPVDADDPDGLMQDLTASTDEEILRTLRSTGKLRVMCCTWNMHGEHAPDAVDMARLLTPGRHHVVMMTTQECERTANKSVMHPSKAKWEAALQTAFGNEYVMVRSHGLAAIHVSVVCHRALVGLLTFVDSAAIATGLGKRSVPKSSKKKKKKKKENKKEGDFDSDDEGLGIVPSDGGVRLGNKGGVGIALCIGSTSMLFVGAHLAAHQSKCDRRNQDFFDIDYGLLRKLKPLPKGANNNNTSGNANVGASTAFDMVFWGGDFNYRVNGNRKAIDALLAHDMHAVMLANDQLAIQMKRGAVFPGFSEGPVNFRPTYKLNPGSNPSIYDTSKKKRIPSWTDRVLWRANNPDVVPVSIIEYQSVTALKMSDHFPVRAGFEVGLFKPHAASATKEATGGEKEEAFATGTEDQGLMGMLDNLLGVTRSQICVVS